MSDEKSTYERAHFGIIKFVHDTLYRVFVNPHEWLRATGLAAGQRVLEVGCGPGFFTIPAAETVGERGRVYALDNNPAAVEYVKRKVQLRAVRNVEVILADAAKTGIPDGSLDVVFLFGVLHALWDDVDSVLKEAHRVLRAGGTLSIRSRLPEEQVIDGVTRSGKFRLLRISDGVLNFENVQ
jgi:ubiquinone/menaquinone biosynthesis C-methylase UbiE